MNALAAILFWLALIASILLGGLAFMFALRSGRRALLMSLTFSGIVLILAWRMDDVFQPNLWVTALGAILVVAAAFLFRSGHKLAEQDVMDSDYYLAQRRVSEKLHRMGPGCLVNSLAFACLVLGCGTLFAQLVAFLAK